MGRSMKGLPKRQRVAAYAVILRDGQILLSRLAPRITPDELWTLPGGGLDHGEDPRDAVIREIHEETGLEAQVGENAQVYSAHLPGVWRDGGRVDAHALRIVYDGWVPTDAPDPKVVEVGGSTVEAAWKPLTDVLDSTVPVAPMVLEALANHRPFRHQRLGAYALIRRADSVLLTRVSDRGFHSGLWTLPGGGVRHGESPRSAALRELREECGVSGRVEDLVAVHDDHFSGTAPSGRFEDFHSVALVFATTIDEDAVPSLTETGGTTDAVDWVPIREIEAGQRPVMDLVLAALPN